MANAEDTGASQRYEPPLPENAFYDEIEPSKRQIRAIRRTLYWSFTISGAIGVALGVSNFGFGGRAVVLFIVGFVLYLLVVLFQLLVVHDFWRKFIWLRPLLVIVLALLNLFLFVMFFVALASLIGRGTAELQGQRDDQLVSSHIRLLQEQITDIELKARRLFEVVAFSDGEVSDDPGVKIQPPQRAHPTATVRASATRALSRAVSEAIRAFIGELDEELERGGLQAISSESLRDSFKLLQGSLFNHRNKLTSLAREHTADDPVLLDAADQLAHSIDNLDSGLLEFGATVRRPLGVVSLRRLVDCVWGGKPMPLETQIALAVALVLALCFFILQLDWPIAGRRWSTGAGAVVSNSDESGTTGDQRTASHESDRS